MSEAGTYLSVAGGARTRTVLSVCALLILGVACSSREPVSEKVEYPAPRFPRYVVDAPDSELLAAARFAVRQTEGRCPLGKIQSGQDVHVLIEWGQDPRVWEVIKQAWAERGVTAHALGYWEVAEMTPDEYDKASRQNLQRGEDGGWKELGNFRVAYRQFFPENIQKEFGERPMTAEYLRVKYLANYLERHPNIQRFFAGMGGGGHWERGIGPDHDQKFMGNWIYYRPIDLLSKHAEFPPDVWNLVEEKIVKPIPFVAEVTFKDPEGTDLHFTMTPEQSKAWTVSASAASNHLHVYPNPRTSTLQKGAVVGAHANHMGIYPSMRAYLNQNGAVERIEGGGKTGELLKMLLDHPKLKNARFPKAHAPGYWFLRQDGFATNPKFVRGLPSLVEGSTWTNSIDRNRAGVQHFSFAYSSEEPEDAAYAKAQGIPFDGGAQHTAHMHVYFPTVRWKLRDTGEWITIADKGIVKAFDDTEVVALAARYGDPKLIFRYEWIPTLPGVNAPGEYQKDFAPNPWQQILQEWGEIKSGRYAHFVDNYPRLALW